MQYTIFKALKLSVFATTLCVLAGQTMAEALKVNPKLIDKIDPNIKIESPVLQRATICKFPKINMQTKQIITDKHTLSVDKIAYDLYLKNDNNCNPKGLILLSNYKQNQPNKRNDNSSDQSFALLQNMAKSLADKGYAAAIVYHHADQNKALSDWNAQGDILLSNNEKVFTDLTKSFFKNIDKSKTVYVGSSYTGFAYGGFSTWDQRLTNAKGFVFVQSGASLSSIHQFNKPVISYICKDDPDVKGQPNIGGAELYAKLPATIKAKSKGVTDPICSGQHTVSQSWAMPMVTAITNLF